MEDCSTTYQQRGRKTYHRRTWRCDDDLRTLVGAYSWTRSDYSGAIHLRLYKQLFKRRCDVLTSRRLTRRTIRVSAIVASRNVDSSGQNQNKQKRNTFSRPTDQTSASCPPVEEQGLFFRRLTSTYFMCKARSMVFYSMRNTRCMQEIVIHLCQFIVFDQRFSIFLV